MACNCGGAQPAQPAQAAPQPAPNPYGVVVYQLTFPDGTLQHYYTFQEAEAANRRAGNTGVISMRAH